MSVTPDKRREALLSAIADGTSSDIAPRNREEFLLKKISENTGGGGGSGGEVTPASVASAISGMNSTQKTSSRTALGALSSSDLNGYAQEPTVTNVTGTEPSINAADNTIYKCGEVESITITAQTGSWTLIFTSGDTAATLAVPDGLTMPDDFEVEANRRYEINVSDGYAVTASWGVGA